MSHKYTQGQSANLSNDRLVLAFLMSCDNDNTLVFLTALSNLFIQVLVKSLFDRGFLFLLSSAQMVESKGAKKLLLSSHNPLLHQLNTYLFLSLRVSLKKTFAVCFLERRGRVEKNLQALFIFQESRMVVKYCK